MAWLAEHAELKRAFSKGLRKTVRLKNSPTVVLHAEEWAPSPRLFVWSLGVPFLFHRHASGTSSPLNTVWSFHFRLVTACYLGHMTCSFARRWLDIWRSFSSRRAFLAGRSSPFNQMLVYYQVLHLNPFVFFLPQKGAMLALQNECNNNSLWKCIKNSLELRLQCL